MQGHTGQLRALALLLAALSNFEKLTSTLPCSLLPVTGTKGTIIPCVVWRPGLWDWCLVATKHQPFLKMEVQEGCLQKISFPPSQNSDFELRRKFS